MSETQVSSWSVIPSPASLLSISLSFFLSLCLKHSLLFHKETGKCKLLCLEAVPVLINFAKHDDSYKSSTFTITGFTLLDNAFFKICLIVLAHVEYLPYQSTCMSCYYRNRNTIKYNQIQLFVLQMEPHSTPFCYAEIMCTF